MVLRVMQINYPQGNRLQHLCMVWEASPAFPHLQFYTPERRIADSKLGTPRARPEQLYSSAGSTSLHGRTIAAKLLWAHMITFSTVPALRQR